LVSPSTPCRIVTHAGAILNRRACRPDIITGFM
jgi:hypothetical protein